MTTRFDPEAAAERAANPGAFGAVTSLLPTVLFLVFDAWFGLVPAMIATSVTSVALILIRRNRGFGIGVLLPVSLAYVIVKAVAGVVSQSELVFFGAGLVLSALIALAIGATAFTPRPIASYLIPYVTPYRQLTVEHPVYRRVTAQVTAVWALAELGVTGWEARHLTVSTASEFVIARAAIAWPVMAVLIFFLIFYVRFRLDRHEFFLARSRQN